MASSQLTRPRTWFSVVEASSSKCSTQQAEKHHTNKNYLLRTMFMWSPNHTKKTPRLIINKQAFIHHSTVNTTFWIDWFGGSLIWLTSWFLCTWHLSCISSARKGQLYKALFWPYSITLLSNLFLSPLWPGNRLKRARPAKQALIHFIAQRLQFWSTYIICRRGSQTSTSRQSSISRVTLGLPLGLQLLLFPSIAFIFFIPSYFLLSN